MIMIRDPAAHQRSDTGTSHLVADTLRKPHRKPYGSDSPSGALKPCVHAQLRELQRTYVLIPDRRTPFATGKRKCVHAHRYVARGKPVLLKQICLGQPLLLVVDRPIAQVRVLRMTAAIKPEGAESSRASIRKAMNGLWQRVVTSCGVPRALFCATLLTPSALSRADRFLYQVRHCPGSVQGRAPLRCIFRRTLHFFDDLTRAA